MCYKNDGCYKTAIYCRLSKDDEQAGESVSIETQKMSLIDYCKDNKFEIYDIYVDDGYSGLNFKRPAFMRLLNDIDDGKVNLVITKDLSRLGRDYIQTGYFTDIYFNKKRVRYIAVNDGIDTFYDNNDIAPFKNILNDMYAKDLSRKVKHAKHQRAMKGYYISSQAPFGYKQDPDDRNHLIVDTEAADIVRMIFGLAAQGNSYSGISRKLTALGIITPGAYKAKNGDTRFIRHLSGKDTLSSWSYQTVYGILQNPVYRGDMVNHKTETVNYKTKERVYVPRDDYIIVPDCHEAIISSEEFDNVHKVLNSKRHNQKHNFENVFRGRVFCSECGTEMTLIAIKDRKGKKKALFKCFNHYNNPEECKHYHAVLYNDLYDEILKRTKLLFNKIRCSRFYEELKLKLFEQTKAKKAEDDKEKILKEISAIKKSASNVRKGSVLPLDIGLLNDLLNKQNELTQRLRQIECGKVNYEVDMATVEESLNNLFDVEELNEKLVSRLIKKIEVGEAVTIDKTSQRNIIITYSFEEFEA